MSWLFLPCPKFVCWMKERRNPQLPAECEMALPHFWPQPHSTHTWESMEVEHWPFRKLHSSTSSIKYNKQQLWAASSPGGRVCWDLTRALWDPHQILSCESHHTTSWGAKATTSSVITHHPYLTITTSSINFFESKQIATKFFCEW